MDEVRALLAIGPRAAGTDGARKAAKHIAQRLRDHGIDPLMDSFTDPTPDGSAEFHNVIGVIEGTVQRVIILASHFDTKRGISPDFQGANDSGSSTGLLLELARILSHSHKKGPDIIFAFFDGEECARSYGPRDGLHGSRYMARTLIRNQRAENVIGVIVLDMIGDKDLNITIPRNTTPLLQSLTFKAAASTGARRKFSLSSSLILDDHSPFIEAGIPAIDIIDFEYGTQPGKNDLWHTRNDTIDNLSAESLRTIGDVTLRLITLLEATTE